MSETNLAHPAVVYVCHTADTFSNHTFWSCLVQSKAEQTLPALERPESEMLLS